VQARLRSAQVSVAAELQADCLAGATLQGAVDDGDLLLEPGDTDELATALAAVADEYPWADPSSHGDARERTEAFSTGASGGLRACV
jgi:predicted metalloprotease